jgi:prepilin-type N-terminal cleavage/methylation domain-containing protein
MQTSVYVHQPACRRGGFTLIELLVVITIIAVLAALLMPATSNVLERAREMQCLSNQKQIVLGQLAFERDHERFSYTHEWVSAAWDWWSEDAITNLAKYPNALYPYVNDLGVYLCPTFYRTVRGVRPDAHRSYSINVRVDMPSGSGSYASPANAWKSSKVQSPALCGMVAEENITAPTYVGATKMSNTALNDGKFCWGGADCLSTYHRDEGSIRACFDGHSERMKMDAQAEWRLLWDNTK